MIMLAAELGLRRAEIAVIHHNDLQQTGSGWHLIVHGKGRKQRTNPLPEHLAYWLNERTNLTGYAFPGNDHGHLSPSRVGKLISAALPAGWTAHTLRHRYATAVWQKSHDLLTIQRLLGHTSPATTQRYIAADDEHLRSVSNLAKL
jgi:integrase